MVQRNTETGLKAEKKKITMRDVASSLFSMTLMTAAMVANVAFADGDAASLFETLINILATVMIAPAVFFAATGAYGWASAHAEGDGPEMKKALGRLAASIMIIVVAVILKASAGTLAGFIQTDIS